MLTPTQREQVGHLIVDYIGMTPAPSAIRELFGPECVRNAPASGNAYGLALWLLDYSLRQPRPDLFLRVVTSVDAPGTLLEVQDLAGRLRHDTSLWRARVLDELWAPTSWPFVDRQELRLALAAVADGTGPAAITIEAPRGYGKRTMCAYIQQFALRHGGFQPVVAELRSSPDSGIVDGLVADLHIGLELDLDFKTTHSDPERHAVVSARRLVRNAAWAPSTAWLVANVVEVTGLEAGLLRFIDELLRLVQKTPAEDRKLRVVLLSDRMASLELKNLPDSTARYVLPEVDRAAVTQWFEDAVPGKSKQLYAAATAEVLRAVEAKRPDPSVRLQWLARHCRVTHRKLAGTL